MTEDKTRVCLLLDFYSELLTEAQYNAIDLYYNEDFSLAEVAENIGISRQGVRDNIMRGVELLFSYEDKLHLAERYHKNSQVLEKLKDAVKRAGVSEVSEREIMALIDSLSV